MSYRVYTTEALVVGSFANNTADKSFLLFAKDAGMLYASARSVREERSKQRYALQDFSLVTVSLVKGKSGWRIGSVESVENVFSVAVGRAERGSVVKFFKLVRRYIQGEEPHPSLFDECVEAVRFVAQPQVLERTFVEEVITARLLHRLGYMRDNPQFKDLYSGTLSEVLANTSPELLETLQIATAEALAVSHL